MKDNEHNGKQRNNVPKHNGSRHAFWAEADVEISGHYSEAWAIAPQLRVEACGSQWKMQK